MRVKEGVAERRDILERELRGGEGVQGGGKRLGFGLMFLVFFSIKANSVGRSFQYDLLNSAKRSVKLDM